jgi:hypothetical protein
MNYAMLRDLDHDPKLAAALGNMVVAWAYAEAVLAGVITRVLGSDFNLIQAGYNRIPTFEARVRFILGLIAEWQTEHYDKNAFYTHVEKLKHLARTRNHWIHGDWRGSEGKSEAIIFDHRVEISSSERRKLVRASDITNHCKAVLERADALATLADFHSLQA